MTPPCSNCHGWQQDLGLQAETMDSCPARDHWVQPLTQESSHPNLREFQQRSQYESTRQSYRQSLGQAQPPLRITINRADLELLLKPQGIQEKQFEIPAMEHTQVKGRLRVRCNHIPLALQGLIQFTDTQAQTPLGNIDLNEIRIGDQGGVHLLYTPNEPIASALNMLTPPSAPQAPLAWDSTGNYLAYGAVGACYTPQELEQAVDSCQISLEHYQNLCAVPHQFDLTQRRWGKRAFDLSNRLPQFLREEDGTLPYGWEVEELVVTILSFLQSRPPSKEATFNLGDLKKLASYLKPGSQATLHLSDLTDLFIPHLLDLGPSSAKLELRYGSDQNLWLELSPMKIQGEAMMLGGTQVESWQIQSGSSATNELGEMILPGVRIHLDAHSDRIHWEANLEIGMQVHLPYLGLTGIRMQVLASTQLEWKNQEIRFWPGKTHLELKDLEILPEDALAPWLEATQFILSDKTNIPFSGVTWQSRPMELRLKGRTPFDQGFSWEGKVHLPIQIDGSYDLAALPNRLELEGSGSLEDSQGVPYFFQAHLAPGTPVAEADSWQLALDLQRQGPSGLKDLIRGGHLEWSLGQGFTGTKLGHVEFQSQFLDLAALKLQDNHFELHWELLPSPMGTTQLKFSRLKLSADASPNRGGLFRGPMTLEQRAGKVIRFNWDPESRELAWRDLDVGFALKKLDAVPRKLRRKLNPSMRYVGMDGRIRGHFRLWVPEDGRKLKGRGRMVLRGDRWGDVYWQDRYGRRVGEPLIRETRWKMTRLSRVKWNRHYALGRFHLDTLINPASILQKDPEPSSEDSLEAYDLRGRKLKPHEFQFIMSHNNQPWHSGGMKNRILLYLNRICIQSGTCDLE